MDIFLWDNIIGLTLKWHWMILCTSLIESPSGICLLAQFYQSVKQKLLVVWSSQDDIYEESHDGSADQTTDGNRDEPGDEDVPEQTPVNWFPGAQPSHGHHGSHLCSHDMKVSCDHLVCLNIQYFCNTCSKLNLNLIIIFIYLGGSFITLQWVVLTGRPILDATTTVSAEASSMLNPLNWKKIC